ncbi:2-keto-3-deoxy-galactonokinase [Tritonibacter multivorans]|uniref:2-keto-3-deoxy-galactonokinase n=1 Tax=Tritonibacter multivorans TaxID=928856 RepID=A0A0P1G1P8_9RHOB|nr:2-dehydro-3-deoxygalactonokinase [Tritonibacter multivorans]MDA7419536.1 2-dehydro-3-deoxygalactonokinase [Tritonibacter multivorans]CUH75660.1 2-keto-3-deoxy-galactonokinase [Tritonibacter multivorans]SFC63372.1 2-dehydro-3-deoxygalactonokinase [Tritonibacter multivorans]
MASTASAPRTWIALDADHSPWRAWVMGGGEPTSHLVSDMSEAARLAPGAEVLVSGLPGTPGATVPEKPARLKPLRGSQQGLLATPTLTQKAPAGVLAAATLRIDAFLSLNPDWDGVLCLPGASTHWVQISAEEVVSFQSFATVQLVQGFLGATSAAAPDPASLRAQSEDVMSRPERLAARLSEAQTGLQLGHLTAEIAAGQIWGACLGAELAAARPYWLGQNLAVIAPAALEAPYCAAIEHQGLPVTRADEARLTRLGFERAWARKDD